MVDLSKYRDIAPYRGDDFKAAIGRLIDGVEYLGEFISLLVGSVDEEKTRVYFSQIMQNISRVTSYDDFLRHITAGLFIPTVINRTMTEFTSSGAEKLDPEKGYLFVSNHRDIILDCALLDYALSKAKLPVCEMAFGDNLIVNSFIEDLFRLNGGIIIRRELPIREKYIESIKISEYFHQLITEVHHSVWVAQKSGRSKDGLDITQPAILKMLFLSQRSSGEKFSDLVGAFVELLDEIIDGILALVFLFLAYSCHDRSYRMSSMPLSLLVLLEPALPELPPVEPEASAAMSPNLPSFLILSIVSSMSFLAGLGPRGTSLSLFLFSALSCLFWRLRLALRVDLCIFSMMSCKSSEMSCASLLNPMTSLKVVTMELRIFLIAALILRLRLNRANTPISSDSKLVMTSSLNLRDF